MNLKQSKNFTIVRQLTFINSINDETAKAKKHLPSNYASLLHTRKVEIIIEKSMY